MFFVEEEEEEEEGEGADGTHGWVALGVVVRDAGGRVTACPVMGYHAAENSRWRIRDGEYRDGEY